MAQYSMLRNLELPFADFKILKFTDIYRYFIGIHMFKKVKQGHYGIQFRPIFQMLKSGPKLWHEFPAALKAIDNSSLFKKVLKRYFKSDYNESTPV